MGLGGVPDVDVVLCRASGCVNFLISSHAFFSVPRSPFPRVRAAIHVQYLTRGERRIRQEQNCIDDFFDRSEEHTSELQSRQYLVCRLLLEKKKTRHTIFTTLYMYNFAESRTR